MERVKELLKCSVMQMAKLVDQQLGSISCWLIDFWDYSERKAVGDNR